MRVPGKRDLGVYLFACIRPLASNHFVDTQKKCLYTNTGWQVAARAINNATKRYQRSLLIKLVKMN